MMLVDMIFQLQVGLSESRITVITLTFNILSVECLLLACLYVTLYIKDKIADRTFLAKQVAICLEMTR